MKKPSTSRKPKTAKVKEPSTDESSDSIHEIRKKRHRIAPFHWFFHLFPRTFRRHISAFWLSVTVTFLGFLFGGILISLVPEVKEVLTPFPHLMGNPCKEKNSFSGCGFPGINMSDNAYIPYSLYDWLLQFL